MTAVKRLVVVLVVLAIVLIAVAAEMKREGSDLQAKLKQLTPRERVQLEEAKHAFSQARGQLLRLRDRGGTAAEVKAQETKVEEAAQRVVALGGAEALRELGQRGREGRGGRGGRGMRGGGQGGGRRGAAPTGRRPGGPMGGSAPAGGEAGTSRGR